MFVKTTNGQVDQYPYTIGDLRKDNPNVSFPKTISNEVLEKFGVYAVVEAPVPSYNERTQRLVTQQPVLINGKWTVTRIVVDKDQAQIDNETNEKAVAVRNKRDMLLTECDWTQVLDAPVDRSTWAIYRQLLRDVPNQPGFPWDIAWPEKP